MDNLNFLPAPGSVKKRVRRGRGNASGLGGEAGRGHKGQKSRSGYSRRFGFEGGQTSLLRSSPKRKGFRSLNTTVTEILFTDQLNLSSLPDVLTLHDLQSAGLVKSEFVKVLLRYPLTRAITLKGVNVSLGAKNAIMFAGGAVSE